MNDPLTHWDEEGRCRMVDVGGKPATVRLARAGAFLRLAPGTMAALAARQMPKGDPLEVARVAGIMAAKRTPDLIPLCHPLLLTRVDVRLQVRPDGIEIEAEARCEGQTGVEMEALTAAAVAGLTLYDMCKAMDKGMILENLRLLEKDGGRGGRYLAPGSGPATR